jgi:hypothetical protein
VGPGHMAACILTPGEAAEEQARMEDGGSGKRAA